MVEAMTRWRIGPSGSWCGTAPSTPEFGFRPILPPYGRQLVVSSLRTKDLKTAKSRLARKSVEVEDKFDAIWLNAADDDHHPGSFAPMDRSRLVATARQYASTTGDREFASRAELFSNATQDPVRSGKASLARCQRRKRADRTDPFGRDRTKVSGLRQNTRSRSAVLLALLWRSKAQACIEGRGQSPCHVDTRQRLLRSPQGAQSRGSPRVQV